MTKATIRSNLSSFSPDIIATQKKGLGYVFGETNSYSCHGAPGVSNTAGAAIWALDYMLFAPQIGISRIHFHQGIGYKYNLVCNTSALSRLASHAFPADSTRCIDSIHLGWFGLAQTSPATHSAYLLRGHHCSRSNREFWIYYSHRNPH